MPEKTLFKNESKQSRKAIAEYLRAVADSLESGGEITLRSGDQSVTLNPPEYLEFEVEAEREGRANNRELSIEFELEWKESDSGKSGGGGDLTIE